MTWKIGLMIKSLRIDIIKSVMNGVIKRLIIFGIILWIVFLNLVLIILMMKVGRMEFCKLIIGMKLKKFIVVILLFEVIV